MKYQVCGLTNEELSGIIGQKGFESTAAVKILQGIYRKGISDFSKITSVSRALRELLYEEFSPGVFPPLASEKSSDNTVKYLFRNKNGFEYETVYIPENKRNTVCVSTQSGCRMGCPFCLTGRYGFKGNLTAGEMINQVISLPFTANVTHVVFMGMGEPMDNIEEVLRACKILTSEWGLALSSRNITVSTVGILPGIEEFLKRSACNLTLSLYSPFSEERKLVVPVENIYPASQIITKMKGYQLVRKRRFSLAYVMIKGFNDTERHLDALKELLTGSHIRVNLLPYHRLNDDPNVSSSAGRMQYFKHNLVISGISASIRKSRGEDISAACGLLASGFARK
jgi:23S rRNA (adenine2503-C2)-methyltransferase